MSTRSKFECLKDLICKLAILDNLPEEVQRARSKVEKEFADLINGNAIAPIWMIGDIHSQAREIARLDDDADSPLTDDEAREILATIDRRHDASIGVNWDVIGDAVATVIGEKKAAADEIAAYSALEEISKKLAEKYPHMKISFGYIGNCSSRPGGYDDRSWRFFYVTGDVRQPGTQSFGYYDTAGLPKFLKYMRKNGIDEFERILQGHVNAAETGWMCKGSMKLGTGCGKCSRCINELTNINGKETL